MKDEFSKRGSHGVKRHAGSGHPAGVLKGRRFRISLTLNLRYDRASPAGQTPVSLIDDIAARVHSGRHLIDMDRGGTPDRYPPVSVAEIVAAEARLGFELPVLLRDIYMQVGNGGFGPGYGLIGLDGGAPFQAGGRANSLVDLCCAFRNRFSPLGEPWAERLLPICTWGCSYFCYLDCALPTAPVMAIDEDSHGHGPWGCAFSLHAHSFEEWMRRWLDGENLWESIGLEGEPIFWFKDIQPLFA